MAAVAVTKSVYTCSMSEDKEYTNILLEKIADQNKVVVEAVGQIQDTIKTLATKEDLARVESKVDTIQAAFIDTNKDLNLLDNRVSTLERAA